VSVCSQDGLREEEEFVEGQLAIDHRQRAPAVFLCNATVQGRTCGCHSRDARSGGGGHTESAIDQGP
jgi:hypothetical protein